MRKSIGAAFILVISATASAQTREQSPYLACGADVAQEQFASNKSIKAIQALGVTTCAPLLERNVHNSYAAMERENGPVPAEMRTHVTDRLRQNLKSALLKIIEINVAVLRQRAGQS